MRKLTLNVFVFLFSVFVALCLAEITARFFLSAPQIIHTTHKAKQTAQTNLANHTIKKTISLNAHPDEGGMYKGSPTGRRLRPNRTVTIENHRLSHKRIVIETNSLGYRNPEINFEINNKSENKKRILFLGDSITFQDYLPESETFVRLVEKKAQYENKNWQTINAGVGSVSLKTELAILLETGLDLKPDVVVLGFYLNDFQESRGVSIIRLPWLLKKSWFLYHLTNWANQQRGKLFNHSEVKLESWKVEFQEQKKFSSGFFNESPEAFNQILLDSFHDYGAAWSDLAWQHMQPLFIELKRLSEQHDFKLVIMAFPVYQQVYTQELYDYPQQQLKIIGEQLDVPVLDLLPLLRKEALNLQSPAMYQSLAIYHDLFYDQCHHTPLGSTLIADEIYRFLQE